MTTSKLLTIFSLCATLVISTSCGKKNTAASKRAIPASSGTASNPATPEVAPAPTSGSQSTYAALQGSWTENCEADSNQQWSVNVTGDVLSYSGVTCGTSTPVPGGFVKKFKLDTAPSSSDFNAHITYLNADGTEYFDEDVTGTTETLALYFSGDDTTYFRTR